MAEDLVDTCIVFAGYLRVLGPDTFHVTALSIGLDPALALKGRQHGLR